MGRWVWFCVCAILGLVMLVCGLLVPAHLRAIDASLIAKAGRNSRDLPSRGFELLILKQLGSASMLWRAAQAEAVPDRDKLGLEVGNLAVREPGLLRWGRPEPVFDKVFGAPETAKQSEVSEPMTEFLVRESNRTKALEMLRASPRADIQELLRCRQLTNTALFAPSASASGQAFDTALAICGLLIGEQQLGASNSVVALASEANRGGNSQRFEQLLLDIMSLGQRLNWDQLANYLAAVPDTETLRVLAAYIRSHEKHLPVIFAAVELSGRPAEVANYLATFSETGLHDLGAALRYGAGGVNELLHRQQRLNTSGINLSLARVSSLSAFADSMADLSLRNGTLALGLKWFFYLAGGFLLAIALHFARSPLSGLERPLQVRGFHIAREILFALGFLLVVLLLSEPFLAQESQKVEFPFKLRLPTVGSTVPAVKSVASSSIMNQLSLLTLLLFFVLQALLYTASLVKLAEIRRQNVPARIKLKLLDNEDHLFDAGLYLGFVGTIISLILVSLGVIKPSLMAAYSSTSFGILFVSIFKIFNLRPLRRRLLLDAEAMNDSITATAAVA